MESREIFWNISQIGWLYALTFIAFLLLFYGCYDHVKFWGTGRKTGGGPPLRLRWKSFLSLALFQRGILRRAYPGVMHLFIFWGIIVLFIGTVLLAIEHDFLKPIFSYSFIRGNFYKVYSFFLDLFGLLAVIGTVMMLMRKYLFPEYRGVRGRPDTLAVWSLFFVLVTGFLVESARIRGTGAEEPFSPIGYVLSALLPRLFDAESLQLFHEVLWWIHLVLALILIAMIPYTKLFHIIAGSFLTLSDPKVKRGILSPVFSEPLKLEPDRLTRLSRLQLLSLDACTQCGRCEEVCPVVSDQSLLSPRRVMDGLRRELQRSNNHLGFLQNGSFLAGFWECLACRLCEEECPISLKVAEKIVDVRRHQVMALSQFPAELRSVFRNVETFGDPFGEGKYAREDWIQGEAVKRRLRNRNGCLVWIGCQSAFHERNKKVAWAFTKLLDVLSIDYFLLGKEEVCCGDLARRTGNEYLFRDSVLKNIDTFRRYGVQKIVTLCPHCFHVMKEEYPHWGGHYEVLHYTELMAEVIQQGKVPFSKSLDKKTVYHDSCYLGRYHDLYREPRSVLNHVLMDGLMEMEKNRGSSVCCGAGGGNFWTRGNTGERINATRLEEVCDKGAQIICTSCPYCLVMFEEAIRNQERQGLVAMDLAELLDLVKPSGTEK